MKIKRMKRKGASKASISGMQDERCAGNDGISLREWTERRKEKLTNSSERKVER